MANNSTFCNCESVCLYVCMYVNFQFIHRVAQATFSFNIKQLVWVVLVSGGGLGPKYGYFDSFFYVFQTAKIFFYFEVKI